MCSQLGVGDSEAWVRIVDRFDSFIPERDKVEPDECLVSTRGPIVGMMQDGVLMQWMHCVC